MTTVLTTLTILAFGSVLASSLLPTSAAAHSFGGGSHNTGERGGHRSHKAALQHCTRLSSAHLRIAEFAISTTLDLNDVQEQALDPIMTVLNDWRTSAVGACEGLANTDDLDAHLAAMATLLSASATAVESARPHIGEFYEGLNTEQRDRISGMLASHSRH